MSKQGVKNFCGILTRENFWEGVFMTGEKRTIHIKGTGYAAQIPDTVVLSMTLTAQNKEYSAAMKIGSQQVDMLREAIVEAGFKADDLKTINFDVEAKYEEEEYKEGKSTRYRQIFIGFECRHDLRLSFDFDNDRLNNAVDTIAASLSQPKISIAFTIKDADAFNDKILKSAAKNARRKAKILNEVNVRHEMVDALLAPSSEKSSFNFQPDEIKANDTVDFLWEIE